MFPIVVSATFWAIVFSLLAGIIVVVGVVGVGIIHRSFFVGKTEREHKEREVKMGVTTVIKAIERFLERRPWLPTALVMASFLVSMTAVAVLFGNLCWASCRFMPELSDEAIVLVGQVQELSAKISVFGGGLLVLSPIVLAYFKKFRAVVALLVWGRHQ